MWNIAKGILWFLDGFFSIIDKVWRFRFFDNDYVNKIFGGAIIVACSWLALKVIIELIMNFIVKNDERSSPLSVYKGIVLAIVMMFLISPLFNFGQNFSTALTDSVIQVSDLNKGDDAENTIAKSLIRAMVYENEMEEDKIDELVNGWKTIKINKTTGGFAGFGDCYVYSLNFFVLIIISVITVFLLFFVAIQMAKRVMELALYKIIGPFCCTSLTNNRSHVFESWCKSTMGCFLITVVQFVCIGLLINMFGTAFTKNGLLVGIILIIGALLFIINTPSLVSSLLDHQLGVSSTVGDIKSLMALGSGISHGVGIAKAGVMGSLALGSRVAGAGVNIASTGFNKISNMFRNNNTFNKEQSDMIKDDFNNHNNFSAKQHINEYLKENTKGTYNPIMNPTPPFNPQRFQQPYNTMYNPITDRYSHSQLDAKQNIDRRN